MELCRLALYADLCWYPFGRWHFLGQANVRMCRFPKGVACSTLQRACLARFIHEDHRPEEWAAWTKTNPQDATREWCSSREIWYGWEIRHALLQRQTVCLCTCCMVLWSAVGRRCYCHYGCCSACSAYAIDMSYVKCQRSHFIPMTCFLCHADYSKRVHQSWFTGVMCNIQGRMFGFGLRAWSGVECNLPEGCDTHCVPSLASRAMGFDGICDNALSTAYACYKGRNMNVD